jgi:hypothetical protein
VCGITEALCDVVGIGKAGAERKDLLGSPMT